MTTPAVAAAQTPVGISASTRPTASRVIAWLLLVGWATVAVTWLLAPAPADWSDFEEAAAAGDVQSIKISDRAHVGPLARGHHHRAVVEVIWEERWRTHTTTVVENSRHGNSPPTPLDGDHQNSLWGTPRQSPTARMRSVRTELARLAPDTPVTGHVDNNYGIALGRRVPTWAGVLGLVVVIGSFSQVILLPQPQRATRWAWFWLWCIPGLGTPLFLLGSGATINRKPTQERIRGLTGFLIMVVASTVLSAVLLA